MAGRFTLEGVFKGNDQISRVIAKVEGSLGRMSRRIAPGIQKISSLNEKVASTATRVGVAGAAATAALGAGLAVVVKPALDVEDAMARIETVITPATGTVQDALAETKKSAIDWSKAHVNAVDDYLAANLAMNSAGLNSAQAIAGTNAALTLATATIGDATTAGNLLATLYNNLGDKSRDASVEMMRLTDVLAETQALYQIKDLQQLNEGFKAGAPAALQFGVNVDQLSTALGYLNNTGLVGSMAGTAFAATMRQMGKASKGLGFEIAKTASGGVDFIGTLQNIEKRFGSFDKMTDAQKAQFQKVFGDEGVRAVALMLGKTGELSTALEKVGKSTGVAAEQQRKLESTRSSALTILSNKFAAAQVGFAEAILPGLDQLTPEVDSLVASLGTWVEANKALIQSDVRTFISEGIPLVKAFATGVVDGFASVRDAANMVLGPIDELFGDGSVLRTSNAQRFGTTIVQVGAGMLAFSVVTKAAGAATLAFGVITNGVKAIVFVYEATVRGVRAAIVLYELASNAGVGATLAMSAASKLATVDLIAQRAAALAAATGMTTLAGAAGMAGVAVAGVAVGLANEALKKQTGGLGALDLIGEMYDQGTWDPAKAANEHMNQMARAAAATRDQEASLSGASSKLYSLPGSTGQSAELAALLASMGAPPGLPQFGKHLDEQARAETASRSAPQVASPQERLERTISEVVKTETSKSEVTLKVPSGVTAEVTKQPKQGPKLKLEPSGAM